MRTIRGLLMWLGLALAIAGLTTLIKEQFTGPDEPEEKVLRVLTYSSFLAAWGPGPELAEKFQAINGSKVQFVQADDAGLLLAKMKSYPVDAVVGFDQYALPMARAGVKWLMLDEPRARFGDPEFLAFDWSPMGFVYRKGEVDPPRTLNDLLHERYRGALALQDPRSSSPGLQFLRWLILLKGEDGAFQFLEKLKPNIHSVSGSWSQAYGVFTRGQAALAFSYATSPLFHRLSEKDERYQFAAFREQHPAQIEYAAIPSTCKNCEAANAFLKFMVSIEGQRIIMSKNWMLPVRREAARDTAFDQLFVMVDDTRRLKTDLTGDAQKPWSKEELEGALRRWKAIGL